MVYQVNNSFIKEVMKANRNMIKLSNEKDVELSWNYYISLSPEIQNDFSIIGRLLRNSSTFFNRLTHEQQNNEDLICSVIKNNFNIFKIIPDHFRHQANIIESLIKSSARDAIKLAFDFNPYLQEDKEFILRALKYQGHAIVNLPKKFENDEDFALTAVKSKMINIFHIPDHYLNKPERFIKTNFIEYILCSTNNGNSQKVEKIRKNVENNKDIKFYLFMEQNVLSNFKDMFDDKIAIKSKSLIEAVKVNKEILFQLEKFLSYMMPSWKKESIITMMEKSNNLSEPELENGLKSIFKKELTRRNILNVNLNESGISKKSNKNRKIF